MSESSTSEQDLEARPRDPAAEDAPPPVDEATAGPAAGGAPVDAPADAGTAEADVTPDGHGMEEGDLELSEMEAQLLEDMDRLQSERNDYLDQLLRTRADFDNYRKRVVKQQSEHEQRAAEALVEKLLDVLDTFDLARAHGQGYEQVHDRLMAILGKEGLERIDPAGEEFDPNEADAVAHEDGDGGPVVAEVLRPGYRWKGRVLRPAMVKVKG